MKLSKGLIFPLMFAGIATLASCGESGTNWNATQKKQMIQSGGYAMPKLPFKAELQLPDIESGMIGTTSYSIILGTGVKEKAKDDFVTKMLDSEEWAEVDEGIYAVPLSEDGSLFTVIYDDFDEDGTFKVLPMGTGWAAAMHWFNLQAELFGLDKTYESVFGTNAPEFDHEDFMFWTSGVGEKFNSAEWDEFIPMVEAYDVTTDEVDAFKTALAASNYHIFGWTRRDGSQNDGVYTNSDATIEGGYILQEIPAQGSRPAGVITYLIDGYTNAKYHTGDDICHPTEEGGTEQGGTEQGA